MDKSLATLVKMLASRYTAQVEKERFNGTMPKVLHMRALRSAADTIIGDYQDNLSKGMDSK